MTAALARSAARAADAEASRVIAAGWPPPTSTGDLAYLAVLDANAEAAASAVPGPHVSNLISAVHGNLTLGRFGGNAVVEVAPSRAGFLASIRDVVKWHGDAARGSLLRPQRPSAGSRPAQVLYPGRPGAAAGQPADLAVSHGLRVLLLRVGVAHRGLAPGGHLHRLGGGGVVDGAARARAAEAPRRAFTALVDGRVPKGGIDNWTRKARQDGDGQEDSDLPHRWRPDPVPALQVAVGPGAVGAGRRCSDSGS